MVEHHPLPQTVHPLIVTLIHLDPDNAALHIQSTPMMPSSYTNPHLLTPLLLHLGQHPSTLFIPPSKHSENPQPTRSSSKTKMGNAPDAREITSFDNVRKTTSGTKNLTTIAPSPKPIIPCNQDMFPTSLKSPQSMTKKEKRSPLDDVDNST